MMRATQNTMIHCTGFQFLHVNAYPQQSVVPHVDPPSTEVAEAGKDQAKKGEGNAPPKAAATETFDAQPKPKPIPTETRDAQPKPKPKPIPTKSSSPPKTTPEERNAGPIPSEPKQPMPVTLSTETGGGQRPQMSKMVNFVRPLSKPKVVQEAIPLTENRPVRHQNEPLRPPQNAEAESSPGNTPCAAIPISPIAPPVTQEPAKNENAAKYGAFSRPSPPSTPRKLPPVENEDKRPKRVESPGQGAGIQESPKRSKVDDAKDMHPRNEMGMARGRGPSQPCPTIVLGPNGPSHVKPAEEFAGQKPSPGPPSKPSATLDNNNPGNAQENARNATPHEKSNALPVPTSIKENNEGKSLSAHGQRTPVQGKPWTGYVCLSLLHEHALFNLMKKRAINLTVTNVDPVPKSERLPSVPKFAFIVWGDAGIAQGEALTESERVLEAHPNGYGTKSTEELIEWLRDLFTFHCRRILLSKENVGAILQVDAIGEDKCHGVVPQELSDFYYWTHSEVTAKSTIAKAEIKTPANFVWPDPQYI